MAKLYIQKEVSEKDIDEIVVDVTKEDRFTLRNDKSKEIEIDSVQAGTFWVSYDNVDLFIEALNKAKELWGNK